MCIFFVIAACCLDLYRSSRPSLLSLRPLPSFALGCLLPVHPHHTYTPCTPVGSHSTTARPIPSSHHTLLRDSRILISAAPKPLERLAANHALGRRIGGTAACLSQAISISQYRWGWGKVQLLCQADPGQSNHEPADRRNNKARTGKSTSGRYSLTCTGGGCFRRRSRRSSIEREYSSRALRSLSFRPLAGKRGFRQQYNSRQ